MFLPRTCPVCRQRGAAPCAACVAAMRPAAPRPPPRGLDSLTALLEYRGSGRELVARLKYRNARGSLPWLAAAMADRIRHLPAPHLVTWVPTTRRRRRSRGFDQAELLARALSRHLGVRCAAVLRRAPGPAQTGRSLAERRTGPGLTAVTPSPARVLLVDDVVTSGATLAAAAAALRSAGAVEVHAVIAASTPLKDVAPRTDATLRGERQSVPFR